MTALKMTNICKSFGSVEVLKNIDLSVDEGELVVFVGPSGCGKSTLLRVVAGLEDATSGEVEIEGKRVNEVPPSKRGIAMVFQSYALYPHLTVRGNMSLALKQQRKSKEEIARRIEKASQMLYLTEYLHRRPSELSGGQRQRVAIGRAIVREPKLFLFDEPLSNLDAALRMNTRVEIAKLHRALAASMIYVTHDQIEAMTLADKIVILNDGKVEQIGSPMELYNNPVNQFVASFLGAPSMNFILADRLGGEAETLLGIRPEHLRLVDNGRIKGRVTLVERLGGDTNILVDIGGDQIITVRVFGQYEIMLDEDIQLDYQDSDSFLFETSGKQLRIG